MMPLDLNEIHCTPRRGRRSGTAHWRRLSRAPRRCRAAVPSLWRMNISRKSCDSFCGGRYRIIFTIRDEEVHILHVRHAARKPLKPRRRKSWSSCGAAYRRSI